MEGRVTSSDFQEDREWKEGRLISSDFQEDGEWMEGRVTSSDFREDGEWMEGGVISTYFQEEWNKGGEISSDCQVDVEWNVSGEISFAGQEDGDQVMAASNFSTIDQIDGATSIIQSEGSDSEVDWDDLEDQPNNRATNEVENNTSIISIAENETLNKEEYIDNNEDESHNEDEEIQHIPVQTNNRTHIQREHRERVLKVINVMKARTEESSLLPIIGVTNFRSLSKKINNVKIDIIEREIGITLCSETWQKDSNRKLKTDIESGLSPASLHTRLGMSCCPPPPPLPPPSPWPPGRR